MPSLTLFAIRCVSLPGPVPDHRGCTMGVVSQTRGKPIKQLPKAARTGAKELQWQEWCPGRCSKNEFEADGAFQR